MSYKYIATTCNAGELSGGVMDVKLPILSHALGIATTAFIVPYSTCYQ